MSQISAIINTWWLWHHKQTIFEEKSFAFSRPNSYFSKKRKGNPWHEWIWNLRGSLKTNTKAFLLAWTNIFWQRSITIHFSKNDLIIFSSMSLSFSLLSHLSVFVCHSLDLVKLFCWMSTGLMAIERRDANCPSQLPASVGAKIRGHSTRSEIQWTLFSNNRINSSSKLSLIAQISELSTWSSSLNQKILFWVTTMFPSSLKSASLFQNLIRKPTKTS